jgi:hypothetical protein
MDFTDMELMRAMWDQIGDLHARYGDVPVEIRLLKLTEETGEAAEAFIGMHGLNSRKGSAVAVMTCSPNWRMWSSLRPWR